MTSYPSHRAAQRRGTWHPSDEDATTTASCSDSYDDSDDYTTSTDVPPSRARGGEYGSHTQEGKKVGKPKSPGLKPFLVTSGYGPGCEAIIFPVSTGGRVATRHAVQQMHLTRQDDELIERVLRKANRQRDSASPTSAAHNERERLVYVDEDVGNKSLSSRSSSYSSSSSHASSQAPNMNEEGTRHHRDANNRAPQPKCHQQQVIITKADVEDRSEVAIRWWRRIQTPAAYSPDSRNVVTQEQQPLASQHQNTNLVVGAADTTRCTSAPVAATLSKDATSNTSFPDEPPPASRDVQCNTSFGWQPAGAQKDAQSNTSFRAVVSPVNAAVNTSFGSRSGVSAAVNTSFRAPSTISAATSPPLLPTFVPPAIVPSPARRPTAAPVSAPPFAMLDDIDETQSIQSSSAQSIAPSNRGGGAVVSPRIPSDVPPQVHYVPPIRQHVPTTPANDPLHAMSRDSFALHSQGPLSLRSPVAPSLSATPDERPRPSWADPVEGLGHTPPHATEDQTDSRSPTELDEYVVPNRKQSLAGTSNGVLGSYAHRSSFRMKREDVLQPTPQTPATASSPHVVNNSLTGNSSISVLGRQASLSSLRHQPSSSQLLLARQRSMFTAPSPNKDASASGAASSSWC